MNLIPLKTCNFICKTNVQHMVLLLLLLLLFVSTHFSTSFINIKSFFNRLKRITLNQMISKKIYTNNIIYLITLIDADELRRMLRCFSIGTLKRRSRTHRYDGAKMPMPQIVCRLNERTNTCKLRK